MKAASLQLILIFFLSLVLLVQTICATEMSDSEFILYPDVQGSGGGNVTDGDYNAEFTAGQSVVSSANDNNYTIYWGFWAPNTSTTANKNPYYKEWVPLLGSYIDRDKNNPAPGESVNFWVYVFDAEQSNTTLNATFYWRTTPTWNALQMTYNYPIAGVYGVNFFDASITAKTTMWYYVNTSDEAASGALFNVTPPGMLDTLYWDNPPAGTGSGTGGGGGGGTPSVRGQINITEYPKSMTIEQGGIEYEYVKVKNIGDGALTDVYVTLDGIDINWYTVDPVETDITPGEEETFIIKFKIPDDAEKKVYRLFIHVDSDQDTERELVNLEIVDWPKGAIIKIVDVEIPELRRDHESTIYVMVENSLFRDKNVTLSLVVPEDWNLEPKELEKNIPAFERVNYAFNITPTKAGVFGFMIFGKYDDKQLSEDVIVNVREWYEFEPIPWWWTLIFIIIVIILLTIVAILYYRHKKKELKKVTTEKRALIHEEVKDLREKVLKPKLTEADKRKLQRILRDLEKAKKDGLITEHIYWKSKQRINKKLRGGD